MRRHIGDYIITGSIFQERLIDADGSTDRGELENLISKELVGDSETLFCFGTS